MAFCLSPQDLKKMASIAREQKKNVRGDETEKIEITQKMETDHKMEITQKMETDRKFQILEMELELLKMKLAEKTQQQFFQPRRFVQPRRFHTSNRQTSPIDEKKISYKIAPCKYDKRGECMKGSDCTYWHEGDDKRGYPKPTELSYRIPNCNYGVGCRNINGNCNFYHPGETFSNWFERNRNAKGFQWKTQDCRSRHEGYYCDYAPHACNWNHGVTVGEGDDAIEI